MCTHPRLGNFLTGRIMWKGKRWFYLFRECFRLTNQQMVPFDVRSAYRHPLWLKSNAGVKGWMRGFGGSSGKKTGNRLYTGCWFRLTVMSRIEKRCGRSMAVSKSPLCVARHYVEMGRWAMICWYGERADIAEAFQSIKNPLTRTSSE